MCVTASTILLIHTPLLPLPLSTIQESHTCMAAAHLVPCPDHPRRNSVPSWQQVISSRQARMYECHQSKQCVRHLYYSSTCIFYFPGHCTRLQDMVTYRGPSHSWWQAGPCQCARDDAGCNATQFTMLLLHTLMHKPAAASAVGSGSILEGPLYGIDAHEVAGAATVAAGKALWLHLLGGQCTGGSAGCDRPGCRAAKAALAHRLSCTVSMMRDVSS